ncbi:carbamoyltransferase HypF [Pleurocapsales cyanobacterium LEGE 10410]|nr:carbamoyltransferase HypF [Pleurocapsales cyanobacterium LEGE 10410]
MKQCLSLKIQGAVQGVGFRPFVYQLATELGLTGWVKNTAEGVLIEVEGDRLVLEAFLGRLSQEKPAIAQIRAIQSFWGDAVGYDKFQIETSEGGKKTASILPDLATCPECQQEIYDPNNRRYRYPFTNCTSCGPRFSIVENLPYDRPNTSMKQFKMCDRCLAEYQNPLNRRFHAQPNACPQCGPHLELWDKMGNILASHHNALLATVAAVQQGKIVALKGLGGFQLVVDARNTAAVQRLRDRKHRPAKPLALMYPSLKLIKADCQVSALEEKLLLSPQAPIVLLASESVNNFRLQSPSLSVAYNNSYLGIMLPYTPLHHLLTRELGCPLVATSGNLSGEPICFDNREALQKLHNIADLFLVHNRPIVSPVDDSIVRVVGGRKQILRRARGYAPLPIPSPPSKSQSDATPIILGVGGQLKNAIAFLKDRQIFLSQYIGDLETAATFERFQQTINDFQKLYELKPTKVVGDRHPNYQSTNYAQNLALPATSVQHHYAHVLSCMADNGLDLNEPVLGVAWDGTGYGLDGTIWGGEFLNITDTGFKRAAHLRTFALPGGERAIQEPSRIAIALLYEIYGDRFFTNLNNYDYLPCIKAFSSSELNILRTMFNKNINLPTTSSMGRLFDGVASLLGIRQQVSYEGQAAMELESAMGDLTTDETYRFELTRPANNTTDSPVIIDWRSMIQEIAIELANQKTIAEISVKFHNTLVEIIVAIALIINRKRIVLTGGCWQNKYLSEKAIARLRQENFIPYWHHRVPCNDGGIALGQVIALQRKIKS